MENQNQEVNVWQRVGDNFYPSNIRDVIKDLEPKIYKVVFDVKSNSCFLQFVDNQFDFGYKVYGAETKFVNRVYKTYNNTNSNLGVLLNGVKGTGKSVTAKLICNAMKLPVIIIDQDYEGREVDLIATISQDCVILCDEFEKVYAGDEDYDNPKVLTLMDGVLSTKGKKLFLFTTNKLYINNNLKQRPGRIRYIKEFSDLSLEAINEVIDDSLVYKEYREDLVEVLKTLEIISIDIVKGIISEINIHNEKASDFIGDFNAEIKGNNLSLVKIDDTNEIVVQEDFLGRNMYVNTNIHDDDDIFLGKLEKIISPVYPHIYELKDPKGKLIKLESRKVKHLHNSFRTF